MNVFAVPVGHEEFMTGAVADEDRTMEIVREDTRSGECPSRVASLEFLGGHTFQTNVPIVG